MNYRHAFHAGNFAGGSTFNLHGAAPSRTLEYKSGIEPRMQAKGELAPDALKSRLTDRQVICVLKGHT